MQPPPSVALVNNSACMRVLHAQALRRTGLAVLEFNNGTELFAHPNPLAFRAIVSDWTNTPTGLQLWTNLLALGYQGRFIFLSPHDHKIEWLFETLSPKPHAILCPLTPNLIPILSRLLDPRAPSSGETPQA